MINNNGSFRPLNYNIRNESGVAIIDIDGYIGRDIWDEWMTGKKSPNTVENLKGKLREITEEKIIVNINSPGGDLNDGLVIKDMLQSKNAEIITNLQGFSASAATVIAQAGNVRRMPETSFMLIHRVMFGLMGYFNQNTFEDLILDAKTIDDQLVRMYERKSSMNQDEIEKLMDEGGGYGRWISAEDALENGLIDEVYDPSDQSDENADHMQADEVENLKRNVERLAIQALHRSDDQHSNLTMEQVARMFDIPNHKESTTDSGSANDARARELDILERKNKEVTHVTIKAAQ